MIEIIPNQSVSFLPFHAEPMSVWAEECDLSGFLHCLFDQDATMTNDSGETFEINYSSYGKYLFDKGVEKFAVTCGNFYNNASESSTVPATEGQVEQIPGFWEDGNFGLIAKYAIAWVVYSVLYYLKVPSSLSLTSWKQIPS